MCIRDRDRIDDGATPFQVDYHTLENTASKYHDFINTSGTIYFEPYQKSAVITVTGWPLNPVFDDEPTEFFTFRLSNIQTSGDVVNSEIVEPKSIVVSVIDPTKTPSKTPTQTATPSYTSTQTASQTATSTPTPTLTQTPSPTNTQTSTPTKTQSQTVTQTKTKTPTATQTQTATLTQTQTNTQTPTLTPTQSTTKTPTKTPTPTQTKSVTPTQTSSQEPTPTATFEFPNQLEPPKIEGTGIFNIIGDLSLIHI